MTDPVGPPAGRPGGRAPAPRPVTVLDGLWSAATIIRVFAGAEVFAFVLTLAAAGDQELGRYFLLASLAIVWIVSLTLGFLFLLRRELAKLRPVSIATASLILLLVATWIVMGSATLLNTEARILFKGEPRLTFLRISALALTTGAVAVAIFRNYWTARLSAVRAKQAQLDALRARIQPHFLFNTLNTAVALVRAKPQLAERVLMDLADLFRVALASPREITLSEELETTRRYLDIEALRLGDRLRIDWRIPPGVAEGVVVPSLSIQPLAENAVRHGIERSPEGGCIVLEAARLTASVRITMSNDVPAALPPSPGHRVGLESARERIAALGAGAVLEAREHDGRFTVVIELPAPSQLSTR